MRAWEMVALLLLCPAAGILLWHGQSWRAVSAGLTLAGLAALIVHLLVEGPHWQMAPLYLAALLLAFFLLPRWGGPFPIWSTRTAGGVSILLILATLAFSWILPMFRLPKPSGAYPVGTAIVFFTDNSRREIHGPDRNAPRQLVVQLWYPAQSASGPLADYRRRAETTWLSSYMSVLKTHSHRDAPVAVQGAPFPVLLFNPAWGGQRTQNTFQYEDLASHGFVVAAIDHTYNNYPVEFPDGRVMSFAVSPGLDDFAHYSIEDLRKSADRETEYQAEDDVFVLNSLAAMSGDPGNRFYRAMDTDMAGAFGHSFGGTVSMEASRMDPRIRAAINMDGWIFGQVAADGLDKPLLIMSDDEPGGSPAPGDRYAQGVVAFNQMEEDSARKTFSQYGGTYLLIKGSLHMDFSDRSLFSPLRRLTDTGPVGPAKAHRIIESYTLAFFNHWLKGKPEPLLARQPSPFADAVYQVFEKKP